MIVNHDPKLGYIGPLSEWGYGSHYSWAKPGATPHTAIRVDWPAFQFWYGGRTETKIFYAEKASDVPSHLLTMPPYSIEYVEAHR